MHVISDTVLTVINYDLQPGLYMLVYVNNKYLVNNSLE